MEYVYASLLLHSAKKQISEENVSKVLEAAGVKAESGRVKALIASLKEVNIEEAIKKAAFAPTAVPVQPTQATVQQKAEKKPEEAEEKAEEAAAEGLGSLFG